MARLTIERCKYDHFELVAIAAERAKQLISGAVPTVPKSNEKFPPDLRKERNEIGKNGFGRGKLELRAGL